MPSDWERVAADPALLAALRRNDAGPGDPLDRLWWAEHPGEPTPAGLPDPAAAVETARRALFRPGASPGAADEVARASIAAEEGLLAARRALAAADAEMRARPAPGVGPGPSGGVRRLLVGPVVAALLIGAAAGFAGGRFTARPAPAALAVFDRAQQADDLPPSIAVIPSAVLRRSTRLLGSSSPSGTSMYAARTADGRVCMLAVVLARYAAGSCTTDAAFTEAGLSLTFPASVDPQDDSGPAAPQELTPRWSPAGGLTF